MKLASFVGTREGISGITQRMIRLRLKGQESHCEIVFEQGDGVDALMPDGTCLPDSEGRLWCFSSTPNEQVNADSDYRPGKVGGCRFTRKSVNNNDWVLEDTKQLPHIAATRAIAICGQKYDWSFIFGFLLWYIPEKPSRKACSEACAYVLGFSKPELFTPVSLRVINKGVVND